ncbi:cytochrome P450 [Dictyobacter alpinus]|uniref:Cytochrome P450 n=1 Tax=Dictyobacter alpinus TaxID=2014873 RepID=A0A402BB76_9CHLR|nr:cytochrome P450 [Dictyobacter alpinus]GCE28527.1 cytochrome P450 [Dictyobacter alpinus]
MNSSLSLFNLMHPDILADPYPFYHRLQTEAPIHWDPYVKAWVCTSYTEVAAALRDPRLSTERLLPSEALASLGLQDMIPIYAVLERQLLFIDHSDHTRLRALMNRAFTARRAEEMRSYIQRIVDQLLDTVESRGSMDVVRDLAYPLPITIIAELLGVPVEDREQLKKWSDDYASVLGSFQSIPDNLASVLQSVSEMGAYFDAIILRRRQEPRDDLISALIAAQETDNQISQAELIKNCILLLAAGHETTTNLIANGIYTLLRFPEQKDRFLTDPTIVASAIEEMLRYESPAQYTSRKALTDLEIGGQLIRQRQVVILIMGAANRDPARFPDPDHFDISRHDNKHLAFGYAAHFCLGAALARVEGQVAIQTVAQRFPLLRMDLQLPTWRENVNVRGLASFHVRVDSSAARGAQ